MTRLNLRMRVNTARDLIGAPLPAMVLISAALSGVLAYGLWTLKYWAYILIDIVVVGGLIQCGMALLTGMLVGSLLRGAILIAVIRYLWKPSVRGAFG